MKIKIVALIATSLLLTGCETLEKMHQDSIKEHCNPNAAYNAGLTDGLTPKQLPTQNYASFYDCPMEKDAINSGYLRGFSEGIKSRPQEITINENKTVNTNKTP